MGIPRTPSESPMNAGAKFYGITVDFKLAFIGDSDGGLGESPMKASLKSTVIP